MSFYNFSSKGMACDVFIDEPVLINTHKNDEILQDNEN